MALHYAALFFCTKLHKNYSLFCIKKYLTGGGGGVIYYNRVYHGVNISCAVRKFVQRKGQKK